MDSMRGVNLIDICAEVKQCHIAQYLTSPEVFNLACAGKGTVEGAIIIVNVDPYFKNLTRDQKWEPKTITLWEARNLRRAGAVLRTINIRLDVDKHWVGRGHDWYTNFHFMLKEFCEQCRDLVIPGSVNVDRILFLSNTCLPKLQRIVFEGHRKLNDLTPMAACTGLRQLSLSGCRRIEDIHPISSLKELTDLDLSDIPYLTNLKPLESCSKLKRLFLNQCTALEDISPLTILQDIRKLDLHLCTAIKDFDPLSKLKNLENIRLGETKFVDVSVFLESKKLKELDVVGCIYLDKMNFSLLRDLKRLKIYSEKTDEKVRWHPRTILMEIEKNISQ